MRRLTTHSTPLAVATSLASNRTGIVVTSRWGKECFMKIAVACDGLSTSAHAAQCDSFMCYTIERGIITDCRNLPNMGITSHDAAKVIIDLGFDAIISGGIDMDMANELCTAGVEVVAGVHGTAREVVEAHINHTLMGAVALCHIHEQDEPEEKDIEDVFDRIAEKLQSAAE